jgi:hypothetical protein
MIEVDGGTLLHGSRASYPEEKPVREAEVRATYTGHIGFRCVPDA